MKFLSHTTLVCLLGILFLGASNTSYIDYQFAFSINPTANNGLITYAVVGVAPDGKIVRKRVVSQKNFVLQVRGQQYSEANPNGEDYWTKNEIGKCYYWLNSLLDKYEAAECTSTITIQDLWRLRYDQNPRKRQDPGEKDGWSAGSFRPSFPQLQILQNYGIVYINDFFHGDNMFKLMKDVQDVNWVEQYMNAAQASDTE